MASTSPCSIEWITIPAPDMEAAKTFYADVFGFVFSAYSPTFVPFRARNVSGALDQSLSPSESGISFSVTVPSMEVAVVAIENSGGRMTKAPYSLGPNAGYCASFQDPNGNGLELYAKSLTDDET